MEETPPRTWGRLSENRFFLLGWGNTPTHVGKTMPSVRSNVPSQKHPHARGEDGGTGTVDYLVNETPPRTWGRQLLMGRMTPPCGNTPTHVGKTPGAKPVTPAQKKHPHARGEDPDMYQRAYPFRETPPRTWGRQMTNSENRDAFGNTPTHVGKTILHHKARWLDEKHPHARGEDPGTQNKMSPLSETPPRTWGRPLPRQGA